MSNPNYSPDWVGNVLLKQTSPSVGSQILIPSAHVLSRNPENKQRPEVVNAGAYPSVEALGKKTPTVRIVAYAKASWFTAALLNALLNDLNTTNLTYQTPGFAIGLITPFESRVFDICRCEQVVISQQATGGPLTVTMDFKAVYGDSEAPTPTTFASASPDAGQLFNLSQVGFADTADQVRSWILTLMRVQKWVAFDDSTIYCADIASGGFGGTLVLEQSSTYNVSPTTAATINIGVTGAGVGFSMLLSYDGKNQPMTTDIGTKVRSFAAIDLSAGGNPVSVSAL